MLIGAQRLGDFDAQQHTPSASDRAILQGFGRAIQFPSTVMETMQRRMVAQCMPPPFAAVLSRSVFVHQVVGANRRYSYDSFGRYQSRH